MAVVMSNSIHLPKPKFPSLPANEAHCFPTGLSSYRPFNLVFWDGDATRWGMRRPCSLSFVSLSILNAGMMISATTLTVWCPQRDTTDRISISGRRNIQSAIWDQREKEQEEPTRPQRLQWHAAKYQRGDWHQTAWTQVPGSLLIS